MAAPLALHPAAHSFQEHNKSNDPSPASSLYTSTDDELHSDYKRPALAPISTRKIRFAPLPDPRRSVLVTDDGEELPLPNADDDDDDSTPPASIVSGLQSPPTINVMPSSPLTLCDSNISLNSQAHRRATSLPNGSQQSLGQESLKSKKSGKRNFLLRPFGRRRSSVEQSSITPEEILTLGTINLFRTSSRESRRSTTSTDSTASAGSNTLARWASNTSSNKRSNKKSENLYRTQSLGAIGDSSRGASARSAPKRMLNGRVYGSKHRKGQEGPNLFANIRDEEPEFVEWGYGGMGSVKNAASHGSGVNWSKVQGSGAGLGANDDDDDVSGLAWVRKRKAERERRALEEKEKADAEAAAAAATPSPATTPPVEATIVDTPSTAPAPSVPSHAVTPSTSMPSTPAVGTPLSEALPTPREEHHHVLTTKVSAPPRHHHHRTHSAQSSSAQLPVNKEASSMPSTTSQAVVDGASTTPGVRTVEEKDEEIASPSGSTSSESADPSSESESDDDDDDDADEEQVTNSRLTSVGAGVEKISRHKDT
ncbi:hypothetical protein BDV98DRAFT_588222 [Pterulicium gracile]|uniref:Uncharacterized protein n=1 Tax=Pterulicium gracile TaxID=1884261 RepID=A0A5C3R0E8_9AGAR|nr:hypothetical protein BDV98DRAFT_588222 [Pterula gracilis]